MKITKRRLRRIILEYISPEQREKDKETLAGAVDLEPNNPDRPDLDLQYVKNLDDGKLYRLPTKVAKEIDTYKKDIWQINKKKLKDDDGQWASVSKLLGTSNWEWSGMQGNEYGDMNDQRRKREKAAKWAADPEGEAAKKKHYDDLYAKAATDAGLDTVSGKVEVEWDLADTEFEGMPYDQAIKAAELPPVVELPGEFEEGELTDWLSDEYGYTNLGWNPVNEGRKMRITKRQLRRIIREQMEEDLWVVIGNAGRGQQNMWPKSDEPEAYPKAEADRIVKDLNSKAIGGYMQIHYHAQPLNKAIKFVSPGNLAYGGLLDLIDQHGVG